MEDLGLIQARDRWYEAYYAGSVEVLDELEYDGFSVVSDAGVQSKQEQLKGIANAVMSGSWFSGGAKKNDKELSIKGNEDVAVVHGCGNTMVNGVERPDFMFSEFWLNNDGNWKVAHLHYSQIKA